MDKPFPIILLLFSLISGLTFSYIYAFEAANINCFMGEHPTAFLSKTKMLSRLKWKCFFRFHGRYKDSDKIVLFANNTDDKYLITEWKLVDGRWNFRYKSISRDKRYYFKIASKLIKKEIINQKVNDRYSLICTNIKSDKGHVKMFVKPLFQWTPYEEKHLELVDNYEDVMLSIFARQDMAEDKNIEDYKERISQNDMYTVKGYIYDYSKAIERKYVS